MTNLKTLLITEYNISGMKVCGHVDHSEAGYLSFLPLTLTQLSLPNNILSSLPPTLPPLLTSFKLGNTQKYLKSELGPGIWVSTGVETCNNLSILQIKFDGKLGTTNFHPS